ncbi:MAG: CTP synthase [Chlamydiia bacterium]|nr:CTP synthase [Chlamydiia bacterium]MCH9615776.1 CTP synthase [Chlamydiia bacterium]MCH9628821.1 CTP synthase [Chlamydiia bacterium]
MKTILMTGGVLSSLGKGITAASIATLLESRGLKVSILKLDPYLNVDPGTMNPFQHGEVYVTDDGAETDLDLGHYYRFSNSPLSKRSNATTGQIYETILRKERRGDFLGNTVQVIPHVTDEIKHRIRHCTNGDDVDVLVIEIGGTVGDIELGPFLEAIRQYRNELDGDCINIHLTYVPMIKAAGEVKTKPTQHSVQFLRATGISPDIILCRCEDPLPSDVKNKIALFCGVSKAAVFEEPDVKNSIYEVPLELNEQKFDDYVCNLLDLPTKKSNITKWKKMVTTAINPKGKVRVGVVGKYIQHQDAYKSVFEALTHGGIANNLEVEIVGFEAETLKSVPKNIDGFLIPGGFGERGFEGKLKIAKHCREKKVPYFGICLGMQVMVVEFARNVLKLKAHSTEMDADTSDPVISLLSEQKGVENLGGTMRLGAYPCKLDKKSKAYKAYGKENISERHRHRYEFNNAYKKEIEAKGLHIAGVNPKQKLCEITEVKDHPWMVGVQFHPEFKSKPTAPHPLFADFIKALKGKRG